ncbi:DUF2254 domain-containing protein [Alteromonadaceae bacterium BrNp21-10]|nr:DUF2254 domain-containing protein [Alteromonadaceae bacterium BrNp21-10]
MKNSNSLGRIKFYMNRLRERLWVKPLAVCALSILGAFLAGLADQATYSVAIPDISAESIETLLSIMSASMLVIAVFTVGAMLSAYTSVSNTATPRAFSLVIADDVSQNALSTFIGAFIFSIIALVALMNGYYEKPGRFALFLLTVAVLAIVILGFVRWVDRIARLGRLGTTIEKVEEATASALTARAQHPTLGAKQTNGDETGLPVYASTVGYVQRVDLSNLQAWAERVDLNLTVISPPGTFVSTSQPLALVMGAKHDLDMSGIINAFVVAKERTFDEDPRFGLLVLSEIASRALSPAVNDPGTAIDILDTFVRLFTGWAHTVEKRQESPVKFSKVAMPEVLPKEMLNDAFNAIARDGSGMLEVALRLQKALQALSFLRSAELQDAAVGRAQYALRHSELMLKLQDEIEELQQSAIWIAMTEANHLSLER